MSKWKCEICGNEFENFHAQGFDNKIYCPLCYFKKENKILKQNAKNNDKVVDKVNWENMLLKKQLKEYKLITIDYQELEARNKELKKQLENKYEKVGTLTGELLYEENTKLINQQKEFIEYMNKTIEQLECDDVDDEEMKGYLIQRIDIFKEILKKYNEKVTDINVGSIGDKRNEKINGLE